MLDRLRQNWPGIKEQLIAEIDIDYGVFDGPTFKLDRFERFLAERGFPWPKLESGRLDLSDDTFRELAKVYSAIAPLRELRSALSEMRLSDLAVGRDGRNRTLLSAFRSRTGELIDNDGDDRTRWKPVAALGVSTDASCYRRKGRAVAGYQRRGCDSGRGW
jgi:hypothetical protein